MGRWMAWAALPLLAACAGQGTGVQGVGKVPLEWVEPARLSASQAVEYRAFERQAAEVLGPAHLEACLADARSDVSDPGSVRLAGPAVPIRVEVSPNDYRAGRASMIVPLAADAGFSESGLAETRLASSGRELRCTYRFRTFGTPEYAYAVLPPG